MDERQIIAKAIAELQWTQAKLAATGWPGIADMEASVNRALAVLREKPDAKEPTKPAEIEKETQAATAEETAVIDEPEDEPPEPEPEDEPPEPKPEDEPELQDD